MKKKILFIINNLNCGGAEKALISLLENMNYSMYSVDLFLFKHEGVFFNKIPKQVNLLEEQLEYQYFDMPIKKAIVECIKSRRVDVAVARICAGYVFKIEKNRAKCEQRVWKYLSKGLKRLDQNYDVAIGYLEKTPIYFCIDMVHAKRKIGFIHNDYDKLGMDPNIDIEYFLKLDSLMTVSQECANVLKKRFPMYKSKVSVMHNIVSPKVINNMSLEKVDVETGIIKIVSIGRLNYQKGFEMAIDACKKLKDSGYKLIWYVIGDGEERVYLEKLIVENKLKETFVLLGIKENPYPYIRESDIYVQPSRYEGKSIAIDEAKILQKPIVVTNFSTAKDQIRNEENGVIVEMDSTAIFNGIKRIIDDENLRNRLINNLSKENLGTESEIEKMYELIERRY
ncbi:glycosyl transferase [Bacillus cereus]|uniref:glycosyltransferase n=1 Tax=Bacillus nitratireducens TaxID=2026193 RepID=UPI000BEC0267|nr:glycosyltransferase [Bacillus nitratireducens]PEA20194.1 glycosyl transferase [Bacillus cereus]PFB98601.1 glycosyl transferase [Bacillus cereus]